jgi:hypothetical protein
LKNIKVGVIAGLTIAILSCCNAVAAMLPLDGPKTFKNDEAFLDYLQSQTFRFFWDEANPRNGLIRDRSSTYSPCSIAAVGFGLSAIDVAIERGWISRVEGRDRTLTTLKTLWNLPQNESQTGAAGSHGWFYHFLDIDTGLRSGRSELSTIDTTLLMMGVIDSGQFFNDPTNSAEAEIRRLSDNLVSRIDWSFMLQPKDNVMSMEWYPEHGYGPARWVGYNEASCLYLLGLGAKTNALPPTFWERWTKGYQWTKYHDYNFVTEPSLFTHQYSQVWIDFRGIADSYMREKRSDYFENSRQATLAQRHYASLNPNGYPNYSTNEWGFTACDGPGKTVSGTTYLGYWARGAPNGFEDGTIAPTAAGSSLPFAPEVCLAALRHFYDTYRTNLWTTEGFRDAYNVRAGWWGSDVIGIDQGPIVLMAENHRTGSTWSRMLNSPIIQRGLQRAGFTAPPPDRLKARVIAPTEVELTWRDNSAYETGFEVEFSTNRVDFSKVATVGPDVTKATVSIPPGSEYQFRLRTISPAGISGYRETVGVNAQPVANLTKAGG